MGHTESLDLEPIIKDIAYEKSLTLTATQIRQEIAEALLSVGVEYVTTLPTGNNIKQRVYLVPDLEGQTDNMCDVWVYDFTNTRWVHVDALKFNINDYSKITDIKDNLTSTDSSKPLSANQGKILKGLVDNKLDTSQGINNASKNLVTDVNGDIIFETKPTIPTASSNDADIKMNGTQSAGSSSKYAKADHVHPSDTTRAPTNHNHTLSDMDNISTCNMVVTYMDNTTETIQLLKYTGN